MINNLVGGFNLPLWKIWFSWDDEILNVWKVIKMFQTTKQHLWNNGQSHPALAVAFFLCVIWGHCGFMRSFSSGQQSSEVVWDPQTKNPQWNMVCFIGLVQGKIYRIPPYLMVKTMVFCRFSPKPIQWLLENLPFIYDFPSYKPPFIEDSPLACLMTLEVHRTTSCDNSS